MGNEITINAPRSVHEASVIASRSNQRYRSQMSPSQSIASFTSTGSNSSRTIPKEIVIVSKGTDGDNDVKYIFPPPFKPLIPLGCESVPQDLPQINPRCLLNLGQLIQYQLFSKAESVSRQQIILCDIIRDIESQSTFLAGALLAEPSRRFNKIAENFGKLNDIDSLISKIENEATNCILRLRLINSALPQHLQLEPFAVPGES